MLTLAYKRLKVETEPVMLLLLQGEAVHVAQTVLVDYKTTYEKGLLLCSPSVPHICGRCRGGLNYTM